MKVRKNPKNKALEEHPTPKLEIIKGLLTKAKLKATIPRINILNMLFQKHGPFTIDEIHTSINKATKNIKSTDLVTVYRCLAKFEALKIVRSCDFGDGSVRYELEHPGHHHHHIICKKCGLIKTLEKCPVDQNPFQITVDGFTEVQHKLEFFGLCSKCT